MKRRPANQKNRGAMMSEKDLKEFLRKEMKKRELFVSNLVFMRLDHENRRNHVGGCNKKWL